MKCGEQKLKFYQKPKNESEFCSKNKQIEKQLTVRILWRKRDEKYFVNVNVSERVFPLTEMSKPNSFVRYNKRFLITTCLLKKTDIGGDDVRLHV